MSVGGFMACLFAGFFVGVGGPAWLLERLREWSRVARMAWSLRAERRRRARALAASLAAFEATEYQRAERRERRAEHVLAAVCAMLLVALIAVIAAGCDGRYPLEPSPDAGADAGLPPCAAPAGYVVISHGCDCASDPRAAACSTETAQGDDSHALVGCIIPSNGEHCISDCAECAP